MSDRLGPSILAMNVGGGRGGDDFLLGAFRQAALAEGSLHIRALSWPTAASKLPDFHQVMASHYGHVAQRGIVRIEHSSALVYLNLGDGRLNAFVALEDPAELARVEAELARLVKPRAKPKVEAPTVDMHLWMRGRVLSREIAVPPWEEIRENYSAATRSALVGTMTRSPTDEGGSLLLWSGPPGTGKTYALRALAWEWRSWCDLHYVSDPEAFLRSDPGYLLDVLASEAWDSERDRPCPDRAKLVVMEDVGQVLSADAREVAGQALGTLLNVTDGLLGQGAKTQVLVTTNETVEALHPAVTRPGRCVSRIAFEPLDQEEAARWLAGRGRADMTVPGPLRLAELFAGMAGEPLEPRPARLGFA